jgi:hypothetical protein
VEESHPKVQHPNEVAEFASTANRWLADHLTILFGSIWTVWAFIAYPLIGLLLPISWQTKVFFISSGWIQLWALPLLNLASNRADAQRAAKADVDHRALTHIAKEIDQIKTKLGITQEVPNGNGYTP